MRISTRAFISPALGESLHYDGHTATSMQGYHVRYMLSYSVHHRLAKFRLYIHYLWGRAGATIIDREKTKSAASLRLSGTQLCRGGKRGCGRGGCICARSSTPRSSVPTAGMRVDETQRRKGSYSASFFSSLHTRIGLPGGLFTIFACGSGRPLSRDHGVLPGRRGTGEAGSLSPNWWLSPGPGVGGTRERNGMAGESNSV